ncbi:MAG: twin-arginine translocase TatA/TatE family subunit [Thermodesulfobacteriota bacterium]
MGIEIPEVLILLVLALILFGPEKLPEYGAKLGNFIARMRQASSEVTQPLQEAFRQETPPPSPPSLIRDQFCHQCGHILEPDFTFCPKCGRRLEKREAGSPYSPDLAS